MSLKRYAVTLCALFLLLFVSFSFTACDSIDDIFIALHLAEETTEETTEEIHVHSFSMWNTISEPSCITQGVQTRACDSCGFTEFSQIPALGHTEVIDAAIPATCTTDGKTEGWHCGVCQTIIVSQTTTSATGHKYDDGVTLTSATCIKNGTKNYTCTVESCQHSYIGEYPLPSYTATEIYNRSIQYVGEITTYSKSGTEYALGTGFAISADGKILTNYHVIEGAYSADIHIDGTTYQIKSVLAYDADIDLAILKIDANNLAYANICKNPVSAGEIVYAIGSSRGMTNTYTQGIITYADRVIEDVSYVQHDASITHGNSGGPLINIYGEVIGINAWEISNSQNLNFAVFAGEIDKLTYIPPLSLPELYEKTRSAFDLLIEFITKNGKTDGDKTELILYEDDNEITVLNHDASDDTLSLAIFTVSGKTTFFCGIALESGLYMSTKRVDGVIKNELVGQLEYETFTKQTQITYTEYEGAASEKTAICKETGDCIVYLIQTLEKIAIKDLGITIADFGFLVF